MIEPSFFSKIDFQEVVASLKKQPEVSQDINPVNHPGFFTSRQNAPFTSIESGPLKKQLPNYLPQYLEDGTPVSDVTQAISEAERHRLVKASKCPTPDFSQKVARNDQTHRQMLERLEWCERMGLDQDEFHRAGVKKTELPSPIEERFSAVDPETGEIIMNPRKAEGQAGQVYTVITHREWSDEFRIRTQVDQCSGLPPEQEGERISKQLSMNGAKKIADSCHYMHLKKGGYQTFLTLTVEPEQRKKLEAGEITLQKELGRFWDAMNQVRKRGFTYYIDEAGEVLESRKGAFESVRVEPDSLEKILYCWVIENPLNADGERNPHIHILMDWGMKYVHFRGWAQRVEKLWGHGFAHLEKMKDTANAGAYMAKAAGYLSKANGADDQGPVKGNRYGISSESRAPDWVQVGRYEAAHMGHLIKDVHDYFGHLYGHLFGKRKQLNKALEETPKTDKPKRHAIGKALAKVRQKCNELPAVAGKFQLMIKGREKFNEFVNWASSDKAEKPSEWLPAKDENEGWDGHAPRPDSNWFKEYRFRLFNRKAGRRWAGLTVKHYQKWEEPEREEGPGLFDWLIYEKWGVA